MFKDVYPSKSLRTFISESNNYFYFLSQTINILHFNYSIPLDYWFSLLLPVLDWCFFVYCKLECTDKTAKPVQWPHKAAASVLFNWNSAFLKIHINISANLCREGCYVGLWRAQRNWCAHLPHLNYVLCGPACQARSTPLGRQSEID